MPLPPAPREIERLTEGWPEGPENFELAAFAAGLRSGRPELSAPALQRVGGRVARELDRRGRAAGRRVVVARRLRGLRRFVPLSAAAAALVAAGAWLHFRPGPAGAGSPDALSRSRDNAASVKGVPVLHPAPADPSSKPATN